MQFAGCFQETHLGKNKNWILGKGWMVKCFAPGESTMRRAGPELPRKSSCPMALPLALAIPAILSHLFCCNILLPKRGMMWKFKSHCLPYYLSKASSLQEKSGHRSKGLYGGYTNCPTCGSPQMGLIPNLQGYPSKPCHIFPQLNQLPWKQFQSRALHYDPNQIYERHSCK